jgi:hypothetical protein
VGWQAARSRVTSRKKGKKVFLSILSPEYSDDCVPVSEKIDPPQLSIQLSMKKGAAFVG